MAQPSGWRLLVSMAVVWAATAGVSGAQSIPSTRVSVDATADTGRGRQSAATRQRRRTICRVLVDGDYARHR